MKIEAKVCCIMFTCFGRIISDLYLSLKPSWPKHFQDETLSHAFYETRTRTRLACTPHTACATQVLRSAVFRRNEHLVPMGNSCPIVLLRLPCHCVCSL